MASHVGRNSIQFSLSIPVCTLFNYHKPFGEIARLLVEFMLEAGFQNTDSLSMAK
jgi:hypothetical protein